MTSLQCIQLHKPVARTLCVRARSSNREGERSGTKQIILVFMGLRPPFRGGTVRGRPAPSAVA